MPIIKIGRRSVASIKALDKPVTYFDSHPKGFGLLVPPSGSRGWIVEYRPGIDGRNVAKRRIVLGRCIASMTPENARDAAKQLLAEVRIGADLATDRSNIRKAETLKHHCILFMERHEKPKLMLRTVDYYQQVIKTHITPAFGSKQAIKIIRIDVARMHNNIAEMVNINSKNDLKIKPLAGKDVANRTIVIISSIYGRTEVAPQIRIVC